jgi:YVTN family beta-propeller protein
MSYTVSRIASCIASRIVPRRAALAGCILGATALSSIALAQSPTLDHVMFVVGSTEAGVYEIGTGREVSRIPMTGASLDTMTLSNGVALFNNTGGNQVIAVNLKDGKEIARIPASSLGGTRPVHSYLSPVISGRKYYVVLNDGVEANTPQGEVPNDSSLTLIDVVPSSPTYLKPVGEVRLGRGHHKVAFSNTRARMVVSNISDCKDVLSVYDFSNPADIRLMKSFAAKDFSYDGTTTMRTCDETGKAGVRLGPHGVGTSAATGEAFHFITGTGQIALIDIDSETPSLRTIQTAGTGGSTAKDMPGGKFIIVPQRTPREVQDRAGGVVCQIGQIAVIDAVERRLVAQTPMLYGDGGCSTSLVGKPEAAANASYVGFNKDGSRMLVALGTLGGAQNAASTVDLTLVFDMSNPRHPKQMAPIRTEARQGSDIVMSNGGRIAFIPNSAANTVSVLDTDTMKVVQTVKTIAGPFRLSTFSPSAGTSKPVGPATLATN